MIENNRGGEKLNPYLRYAGEYKELQAAADVVVIRPPQNVSTDEINRLASDLTKRKFVSILLPQAESDDRRWYPTDFFREVEPWLLNNGINALPDVLSYLNEIYSFSLQATSFSQRIIKVPPGLRGGNYVYLDRTKEFIYAGDQIIDKGSRKEDKVSRIMRKMDNAKIDEVLKLIGQTWKLIPVNTTGISLPRENKYDVEDLDFLLFLFYGKDNKTHLISAESFSTRIPKGFQVHLIPDEEAIQGGCNVADIRRGEILIAPNRVNAPTTHQILSQYSHSSVDILEAPINFLDGGGGPRCSISSFHL